MTLSIDWRALHRLVPRKWPVRIYSWFDPFHEASMGRLRGRWYPVMAIDACDLLPNLHGACYRQPNGLRYVTAVIPLNIVMGAWHMLYYALRRGFTPWISESDWNRGYMAGFTQSERYQSYEKGRRDGELQTHRLYAAERRAQPTEAP